MKYIYFFGYVVLLLITGCGVEPRQQVKSYRTEAMVPQSDQSGWYTFGETRFKGGLVNGLPHGTGLCIDSGFSAIACSFENGIRTDARYLAEKQERITINRRWEIQQQQEQEAYEAKRIAEVNQARKEADVWFRNEVANIPNQMNRQMAELNAGARGTTVEAERQKAIRDAAFYDRIAQMEADPNSQLNKDKRDRERQRAEDKRAADERTAKYEATKKANQAARDSERTNEERQRNESETIARQKRQLEEQKVQREREAKRLEDERRKQEQDRKREADARAAKQKAEEERLKAEKVSQAREEEQRKSNYISNMERGINLKARYCPGGEGKHYIVGIRPRVKPEEVSCIDVYYTEKCPGSAGSASGVIKNFLGAATDCFMGDTAEVSPTPSCKPEEARIFVNSVRECGN